ncbi:MAG: prepilin-type N-terminal cleavage/methylation domain-containing protein [Burkholderiales bacterium]|jgi:prepilin-type N-terminal cleavage/methylation domain-containing protein|nr:prepilin-type N-terminal cleavage/methylation domain-containing protein [Burkholderiales bacterium]
MKQIRQLITFQCSSFVEEKQRRRRYSHCLGFSLLEMAVALVILGVLGFALWKFAPILRSIDETQPPQTQLALVDEAVIGFIMANHRLPCPATDGNGNEAYVSGTGCTVTNGGFPFRTLGVHTPVRLRYGVHQNAVDQKQSLTVAAQRHIPMLPLAYPLDNAYTPTKPAEPEWPLTLVSEVEDIVNDRDSYDKPDTGAAGEGSFDFGAIDDLELSSLSKLDEIDELQLALVRDTSNFASVETSAHINGLDFCAALRDIGTSPAVSSVQAGGISVAYAIAYPGKQDADADGDIFDAIAGGSNAVGSSFVMPHYAVTNLYDDAVLAVGFAELSARLSCPAVLSRANGSGYAARAAYDNYLVALALLQFRAFVLDTAFMSIEASESSLALAIVNIVFTAASVAIGTAVAIVTADEGALGVIALVASIVDAVAAVVGIVSEIVDMVGGGGDMEQAIADLQIAIAKRIEAEVFARKMLELARATVTRAIALDAKGLLP